MVALHVQLRAAAATASAVKPVAFSAELARPPVACSRTADQHRRYGRIRRDTGDSVNRLRRGCRYHTAAVCTTSMSSGDTGIVSCTGWTCAGFWRLWNPKRRRVGQPLPTGYWTSTTGDRRIDQGPRGCDSRCHNACEHLARPSSSFFGPTGAPLRRVIDAKLWGCNACADLIPVENCIENITRGTPCGLSSLDGIRATPPRRPLQDAGLAYRPGLPPCRRASALLCSCG